MSHLTHLSKSGSLHGQKDSFFTYFWVILSVYWPTMAQMSQMTHLGFSVCLCHVCSLPCIALLTRILASLLLSKLCEFYEYVKFEAIMFHQNLIFLSIFTQLKFKLDTNKCDYLPHIAFCNYFTGFANRTCKI